MKILFILFIVGMLVLTACQPVVVQDSFSKCKDVCVSMSSPTTMDACKQKCIDNYLPNANGKVN